MPDPSVGAVHVNRPLTNISIAYKNPAYIADQASPIVPVMKRSDIIPKYDQSYWFRDGAHLRAPATKSRRGGFKVNTAATYFCHRYSYGFEIPDELRDNQDQPFNLDRDGAELVTSKMQLRREVAFATDFFTTGVWGSSGSTDKVGGTDFTQWDDYGNSQPLADISGYMDAVEALVGVEPNTFVLGKKTWAGGAGCLKWHPDLLDTIKYTQRAQMTVDLFAALLEIGKVLIGRAIQVTSAKGVAEASATYARVWGQNGLLMYVPSSPSLMQPAAMYTFVWNRVPNAIQYIKRMRDEEREVDVIEGNSYFDQNITSSFSGMFLSAVTNLS